MQWKNKKNCILALIIGAAVVFPVLAEDDGVMPISAPAENDKLTLQSEQRVGKLLTYDEALSLAHANSETYKIADITRKNTILNANIAKDWIPNIALQSTLYSGGMTSFSPNGGAITTNYKDAWKDDSTKMLNFGLGITFGISGGKFAGLNKLSSTKESANANYNKTLQTYDSNVFSVYWGLKAAELQEDATLLAYNSAKNTYDNVNAKYNVGRISSLDKVNASLALSQRESALISAKANTKAGRIALQTLIGYDSQIPFVLEDLQEPKTLNLPLASDLYKEYLNKSYDIRKSRADEKLSKATALSSKLSAYIPSVSATLSWGVAPTNDTFKTGINNGVTDCYADRLTVGVQAQWALDGFIPGTSTATAIKAADNGAKIASLSRQNSEKMFLSSIESALGDVNSTFEAVNTAKIMLDNAQESYDLTKESFDNGRSTMESLMNAEASLLTARTSLISSKMNYLLSEQSLATTLGITVKELEQKYNK